MKPKSSFLFFALILTVLASGCIYINMYERQATIPSQKWTYDFSPEYKFEIKDTTSRFLIYVTLRHTDQYRYNNIWLRIGSQAPGDTMKFQNLNLQVGGKDSWEGKGMDDIYEVRKLISDGPISFRKPGEYIFSISQIMRENPLKYVLNAGIRLEKVD